MTCIAGIVDRNKGYVVIGGDSASSDSVNVEVIKNSKVFRNGAFIFGCTTSFRMIQLLRYSLHLPDVGHKDIYEYMCTDFIYAIRRCFKEGGYMQKYEDGNEKGGCFLVGYKDRLFKVEDDFQVGETINGLNVAGCGGDLALGSLLTSNKEDSTYRVYRALEVSSYISMSVKPPFNIMSTVDDIPNIIDPKIHS